MRHMPLRRALAEARQPSHRLAWLRRGNEYYATGATQKTICPAGDLEAGSQELPLPADGGIALAKAALGMK